jgi:hypothetical protein
MKTKILRNIFITVGVLFASARLLAAGTFTTFDPPGSTSTLPSAITPSGMIIGSYLDASGVAHGFLRTPSGSFTTIDVPGSTSTTPTGITPGGIITGWYQGTMGGLDLHGFLRALDGSITSFDARPGGYILGSIYSIVGPPPSVNPAGDIAGTYVYPYFVEHGFLRTPDGTFTTIDFPGAFFTEGLAINPAGVIVGDFCNAVTCFQGFLRTPDGTFTVINANAGIPGGINPAGAITGGALDGSGGYLRSPDGTFITFNPPGSTFTAPNAINPAGAITGYSCDTVGCHGFLRNPDGTITTFDPPGSTFTFGNAINPGGVITGAFADASGAGHGFLRIP